MESFTRKELISIVTELRYRIVKLRADENEKRAQQVEKLADKAGRLWRTLPKGNIA